MLLTHNCVSRYEGNLITKFADDTTVAGLICGNDDSVYSKEVEHLVGWCREDNLVLNVAKTKEIITTSRRRRLSKLLWVSAAAQWKEWKSSGCWGCRSQRTSVITKRVQQRPHFLRRLKQASLLQHPQDFILRRGGECSDLLHISVIFQLQYVRQKSTSEDS